MSACDRCQPIGSYRRRNTTSRRGRNGFKSPAAGIKGLIMLLQRSFRKGTAELTYRNRDNGSKLGRLNCKSGGSCELCSRIRESRDSNLNGVTCYSDRIFVCYFLHLLKPVVNITLSTPRPVLQTALVSYVQPSFHPISQYVKICGWFSVVK